MPEPDYDYSYDSDDSYLYSGTDVLINNFGIKDKKELSEVERAITGARLVELSCSLLSLVVTRRNLCNYYEKQYNNILV